MKSLKELQEIRDKISPQMQIRKEESAIQIMVAMGTCGIAAGARDVLHTFVDEVANQGLSNVKVMQKGCIGSCKQEPVVEVLVPGKEKVTYVCMTSEKAKKVITEHIINGNVINEYTIGTNS